LASHKVKPHLFCTFPEEKPPEAIARNLGKKTYRRFENYKRAQTAFTSV